MQTINLQFFNLPSSTFFSHHKIISMCPPPSIPKRTCCDTHVSCEIKGSKDRILVPKLVRRHPSEQIRQQYLRKLGIVNDSRNRPLKSSSTSQPFLRNSSDVALRRFSYQDALNDYHVCQSACWQKKKISYNCSTNKNIFSHTLSIVSAGKKNLS